MVMEVVWVQVLSSDMTLAQELSDATTESGESFRLNKYDAHLLRRGDSTAS